MTDFREFANELAALDALPDHARLTPADASKALALMGLSYTFFTLQKMRSSSTKGPRFHKVGQHVVYELGDLRDFAGVKVKAAA